MFLIGRKIKMEQLWDEKGTIVPVTVLEAGPVTVTQVKIFEKDGYSAIQVGFDNSKKHVQKSLAGHFKKITRKEDEAPLKFRHLRECHIKKEDESKYELGHVIQVSEFQKGDRIKITGIEKGRGFQGVVKRHGFHGGPKTHGQKNRLRAPGSLGATAPQRVQPHKKMAGRMGNETVTLRQVLVVDTNAEKNYLYVKGPIPGNKRTLVTIEKM